jgi:hypothetical protein
MIMTRWPGSMPRSAAHAVHADTGTAAACSNVTFAGLCTIVFAGAYSANEPRATPKTSSPGLKSVTRAPTDSTTPATSIPGTGLRGFRGPNARRPR